jgi:hypothetical protein
MLLVYLEQLEYHQQQLLTSWQVHYWPRSWAHTDAFNSAIPLDWWLLFSQQLYATQWLLQYPENTRVIRTLFDEPIDNEIIIGSDNLSNLR